MQSLHVKPDTLCTVRQAIGQPSLLMTAQQVLLPYDLLPPWYNLIDNLIPIQIFHLWHTEEPDRGLDASRG